jgi:tetratricopeptide (TPR) repeat protein
MLAVAVTVGAGALAQQGPLPPGHPPLDGAPPPSSGALPPGHPPMRGGAAAPSADELLKRLDAQGDLKTREKTFEVAAALGKLYYGSARYADAAVFLGQASDKAEGLRKLYQQQRKKLGSGSPVAVAGCEEGTELEALAKKAQERAAAGDAAGAVACGLGAMGQVLEVEELRGNALMLSGDARGAIAQFDRVLQADGRREAALYGRAMAVVETRGEDVAALKGAKADLEALVALAPASMKAEPVRRVLDRVNQAIAAGGMSRLVAKEAQERKARGPVKTPPFMAMAPPAGPPPSPSSAPPPSGPPALTREQMEAVANTPRTPELEQGLMKLMDEGEEHLARGRYQEALDAYKRVVPFMPESGRAKAGMAWAMVQLNRQPMADRVWMVAVGADPAAVEKLGDELKAKGDGKGAKALWGKLKDSAPQYAAQSGLQKKLN